VRQGPAEGGTAVREYLLCLPVFRITGGDLAHLLQRGLNAKAQEVSMRNVRLPNENEP
jgi:hypothetical protein